MRLILIRHGDPDYEHDTLTQKGRREAALLAERTKTWKVDDVYTSPLGRARATAQPSLQNWEKDAVVLDWAQEFFYLVPDGKGGKRIAWDYFPSEWTKSDENFIENKWIEREEMAPLREDYIRVTRALDGLIASYGYERDGRMYRDEGYLEAISSFLFLYWINVIPIHEPIQRKQLQIALFHLREMNTKIMLDEA